MDEMRTARRDSATTVVSATREAVQQTRGVAVLAVDAAGGDDEPDSHTRLRRSYVKSIQTEVTDCAQ